MSDLQAVPPSKAPFPTTCWSRVIEAGDSAEPGVRAALAELCDAYWYPIYAFVRRRGFDPDAALDLTQDYFARLLAGGVLAAADRRKGCFRAFLWTDCGFFLARRRGHDRARKRGEGGTPLSIDARDAEGRYLREPADGLPPIASSIGPGSSGCSKARSTGSPTSPPNPAARPSSRPSRSCPSRALARSLTPRSRRGSARPRGPSRLRCNGSANATGPSSASRSPPRSMT